APGSGHVLTEQARLRPSPPVDREHPSLAVDQVAVAVDETGLRMCIEELDGHLESVAVEQVVRWQAELVPAACQRPDEVDRRADPAVHVPWMSHHAHARVVALVAPRDLEAAVG